MHLIGIAQKPEGEIDDYRRSDHNDFKDSNELRKIEFSGQRVNKISGYIELWVFGEKVFEMPILEVAACPENWERAYEDVFALNKVKMDSGRQK